MGYIQRQCFTVKFFEVSRFCETIKILLNTLRVIQVLDREEYIKYCFYFFIVFITEFHFFPEFQL